MLSISLKENTKEAHQQLEKIVVSKLKGIRNEADYADLLKYFYAYFSVLEKQVSKYIGPENLPGFESRRTSSFIKQDIKELGYNIEHMPNVTTPEISDKSQAFGALYVMEGSIMGGPYIIQMLAKLGVNRGISFYSGYGENTARKWQDFIAALESNVTSAEDHERVIYTANETFQHFLNAFTSKA